MAFLDRLFSWNPQSAPKAGPSYPLQAYSSINLAQDVGFPEFMRGNSNIAGAAVNRKTALRNASVKRCVNLISNSLAMLPLHLLQEREGGAREKAKDHPLYSVLSLRPNGWQNAFQFRKLMQRRALVDGDACALVLRSRGVITGLVPLDPAKIKVEQNSDWSVIYRIQNSGGGEKVLPSTDVFHLYGDSDNGFSGIALMDEAADVLGLSLRADEAAARVFRNGAMVGGVLTSDKALSQDARDNLASSMAEKYSGAENAAKTLILEEGLKYQAMTSTAKEAQNLETRAHQIEEIARIFGVPRPFLMMDDTSWGSGIEQLGIFFVQYGLAPWFVAWEQAISRVLLTESERRAGYYPKFNERALLRGSMKDQGEFFAKMMGSGGSPQIMEQNEARGLLDLPEHPDGFGLSNGAMGGASGATGQD